MHILINNDLLKVDFNEFPKTNLCVFSPPYNVGIEYDTHKDVMDYNKYLQWSLEWMKKIYNHAAESGRICINIPFSVTPFHLNETDGADDINYPVLADYTKILIESGFKYWRTVIWDKNISNKTCWGSWCSARSPFMRDPSEAILIGYKNTWKREELGESTITGPEFMEYTKNVWRMHPETHSDHPAAFPIEVPDRCIKLLSYKNDWVLDCFMGSGTTGEAAMRLNRNFVGIELSNDYFNAAKDRIEKAEYQTNLRKDFFPADLIDEEF